VHHPLRKGLISLAALAAALVPLSAAQGGAFSGDNGPIAFTCGSDICKVNPDGTGRTTVLTGATDPSWSSDETQITFVDPVNGVSVANVDGSGRAALGAGATSTQPSFSFSGARVAYTKAGDIFTILSNTGGGETNVTNNVPVDADPQYSPDGTRIAFAELGGTGYDIWTIPAGGGVAVHVTNGIAGDERSPTYSPSGATIVYTSAGELFSVAASGGVPQDLGVAGTSPSFSPDGTKIAFINAAGHLAVMAASVGATPTQIDSGTDAQPDWQSIDFANGPPRNLSYPTINLTSGDSSPVVGHFLTSTVGSWEGSFPISYKYQWKRCEAADTANGPCVDIALATSSFYTPVAADVGKRLRVQVTASNSLGTTPQNSEVTAVVTAIAPKLRVTPQINGISPVVDTPLTLVGAVWDGSAPLTFTYSWRRCNPVGDLATCVQIPGATLATYTPVVADIGFSIRVWLTATNAQGTDSGITNHTFPVVDKPHFAPTATTTPAVVGTVGLGRQLTANIGAYIGDAPIKTAFTWQRCDATGGACHVIADAKKIVYFPTSVDIGYTLRITVTATNAYGKFVLQSDPTETIAGLPPHRKGRHIVGTRHGEYLAGGGYDDVILGLGGNDTILGGAGDDRIDGGSGNDVITGGSGADRIFGGAGSDTINAADGERDVVDCGTGRDRVIADSFDKVVNCEVVASAPAATRR
jgi:hypothetical protein